MDITVKEIRKKCGLTQAEASQITDVPLRTYINYENDPSKAGSIKYNYILQKLQEYGLVDESHGILKLEDIVSICTAVFDEYKVHYCYLFGSYAKGIPTEKSDVDLLISTDASGMKFFGLAERLRERLKKKVDLINVEQLKDNPELIEEILKDGIKIYAQRQ
jgi:predicted nucleotidyltransferase/DNA-binding XRE family transcriptional regulator